MSKSRLSKREKALHEQFSRYGRNAKEWLRKCALMLPQIDREQIWGKLGFMSIYHYAAAVAGMSKYQAREALRVLKKIEDKPALLRVAEKKGLYAVRPVATIATSKTADYWAKKATEMTKNTLELFVAEVQKSDPRTTLQPVKVDENRMADRTTSVDIDVLTLHLPVNLARRLDRLQKRKDFNILLACFLDEIEAEEKANKPETVEIQEAEPKFQTVEKPEATESDPRYIPAKIRTYSVGRTGNTCAIYGCDRPIHQLHHADRFALVKTHDPDRLAVLCREHNELVHLGLMDEEGPPETWRVRRAPDLETPEGLSKAWVDQKVQRWRQEAVGSVARGP